MTTALELPKILLAKKADYVQLAQLEKKSDKDDPQTLTAFHRNHADGRVLTLVARHRTLTATGDTEFAGYVSFRSRLKDNLVLAFNVFLDPVTDADRYTEVANLLFSKALALNDTFAEYRRRVLTFFARERDLRTQLLLKACGFRCEKILHKWFDCPPDAAYLFKRKRVS